MNNLTTLQRKLVYLGGIVLLLIPITWLGLPPEPTRGGRIEAATGGKLSRLRVENQLGESSLGNVDPASSTMNLLLLGFRGIATSVLWVDAQDQQKKKDWSSLRATTESIILLQPHFLKVWHFQGWNLAYNVSAEWDFVEDRYYWVKEGVKFFKRGISRNENYPDLYWYTGDALGKKLGRSDEWQQFRKYFRSDPDTARFNGGPDPAVNPEGKDNYLEARTWFLRSNEVVSRTHNEQHVMDPILCRGYPVRALIDYALALQRDGVFDEVTRTTWELAATEWRTRYGREPFDSPVGPIQLEPTPEELAEYAFRDRNAKDDREQILHWIDRYQNMCNYRYWRVKCDAESDKLTAEAHRELYEGEQAFLAVDFDTAGQKLWSGMEKLEQVIENYPDLNAEDLTIDAVLVAQLFWRESLSLNGEELPDEYPLKTMWLKNQPRVSEARDEFNRRRRVAR
jgi:hypothetical protein